MGNSPTITGHPNLGSALFTFAYTFIILWLIVAVRRVPTKRLLPLCLVDTITHFVLSTCPTRTRTLQVVSGTIIDNLGSLRDLRSRIADDLSNKCFIW